MNAKARQLVKSLPKAQKREAERIVKRIAKDFGPAIKKLAKT
jgi:hypothetical protein